MLFFFRAVRCFARCLDAGIVVLVAAISSWIRAAAAASAAAAAAANSCSRASRWAIAILLVLAYHANWIGSGWIGVQWFFVLSGFLITRLLLGMERGQGRWRAWWHFVGRRALRIFPVYYAFLGAVLLAATLGLLPRGPVFEQAPWVASYTYNWLSAGADLERTRAFDHLWSLAIEEQFYLLWPLLVLGLSRRGLWIACGLLVAAGPLLRGIIAGWWPLLGGDPHLLQQLSSAKQVRSDISAGSDDLLWVWFPLAFLLPSVRHLDDPLI